MWKFWFSNVRKLPFVKTPSPHKSMSKFYDNEDDNEDVDSDSGEKSKSSSDIDLVRSSALASMMGGKSASMTSLLSSSVEQKSSRSLSICSDDAKNLKHAR